MKGSSAAAVTAAALLAAPVYRQSNDGRIRALEDQVQQLRQMLESTTQELQTLKQDSDKRRIIR